MLLSIATGGRESDLRTALLDFASRSNDGSEDEFEEPSTAGPVAIPIESGERRHAVPLAN